MSAKLCCRRCFTPPKLGVITYDMPVVSRRCYYLMSGTPTIWEQGRAIRGDDYGMPQDWHERRREDEHDYTHAEATATRIRLRLYHRPPLSLPFRLSSTKKAIRVIGEAEPPESSEPPLISDMLQRPLLAPALLHAPKRPTNKVNCCHYSCHFTQSPPTSE